MNNEFKKIKIKNETRYVLETASVSATSAGAVATAPSNIKVLQRRLQELKQRAEKLSVPTSKPRNPSGMGSNPGRGTQKHQPNQRQKSRDDKKLGMSEEQNQDHEISMASSELQSITKDAAQLLDMVRQKSEEEGLEAWQQSKITKAADFMNSVLQSLSGDEEGVAEADTKPGWMLRQMAKAPAGSPNRAAFDKIANKQAAMAALKQPSKKKEEGVAEGTGPQKGDPVYYGSRLVGWFLGYSKYGKVITEPNYDEMGDEYANRDVYWDKDAVTIKSNKQGVAEDDGTPGYIKYEQMKDKIASVLIKLYDQGNDEETIKQMSSRVARHLGYNPEDPIYQDAWMSSFTDASLDGSLDREPEDDYTDYTMRQGEVGRKGMGEGMDSLSFWKREAQKAGGAVNIDWYAIGVEHGKQGIVMNPPYGVGGKAVTLYGKGLDAGKQGIAEGNDPASVKFGKYIEKYFGQVYDYGDAGLDYLDNNAPLWANLFNKHNSDIDAIIANEPADVLKKAAIELKGIASDLPYELGEQGVAEAWYRNSDDSIRAVDHKKEIKELNIGDTFEYGFFDKRKGIGTVIKLEGPPDREYIIGKTMDGKLSKFPYRGSMPKNGYYIKKLKSNSQKSVDEQQFNAPSGIGITSTRPDKDGMVTVGYDTTTGEPIREPAPPKISTSWRISPEGKEFLKQAYTDIKDAFETGSESYADSTAKAYSDAQMEKFPGGSNYDSTYNDFTVDISRIYDKIKSDRKNDDWRRASQDAASSGPLKIDTGNDDEDGDNNSDLDVLKKIKENWPIVIKFLMSKEGRDTIRQGLKLPQFKGWSVGEFIRYTKDSVMQGTELDPSQWKEDQLNENSDNQFKRKLTILFTKILQKSIGHGVAEGLRDPKDNPCWKGYKPVGTKKKNGKTVPNCVPTNEDNYFDHLTTALESTLKK